jgi:hypothetical protein
MFAFETRQIGLIATDLHAERIEKATAYRDEVALPPPTDIKACELRMRVFWDVLADLGQARHEPVDQIDAPTEIPFSLARHFLAILGPSAC